VLNNNKKKKHHSLITLFFVIPTNSLVRTHVFPISLLALSNIIFFADIVECIIGDEIVDETDAFVDNDQRIKVERGDTFEWARLRLLDTKIVDEMLSASEISAVTAHLKTNHTKSFKLLTDLQLRRLVSSTPVTTFSTATQVRKS
jgi:hypothetical protein